MAYNDKTAPPPRDEPAGPITAQIIERLAKDGLVTTLADIAPPEDSVGLPKAVPVAISKTGELKSVKSLVDEWRVDPERRTGTAQVDTLQSFIDLTNYHKDGDSALFGATAFPSVKLTAVIDYHRGARVDDGGGAAHQARWMRHKIVYAFPLTEEFKAWMGQDGKPMEQATFAAFLEEHAAELAAPFDGEKSEYEPLFKERFAAPAELIDLSRRLEIFVNSKFQRAERLQTGERTVVFESEHVNGKGEPVTLPGIFMVAVPAWLDGAPVRIPARLRYRAGGGTVTWFYDLYRPEFWLRNQVIDDLTRASKETALPAYLGAPEA